MIVTYSHQRKSGGTVIIVNFSVWFYNDVYYPFFTIHRTIEKIKKKKTTTQSETDGPVLVSPP